MRILDRFRKKKPEAAPDKEAKKEPSLLEQLCGDDKLLYEDLSWSLYLDPRNKGTYEESMRKAESLEREGKTKESLRSYQNAGALAMYESNAKGVKMAFDKVAELSSRKFERIRAVPEKAVEITSKFYEQAMRAPASC